MFKKPRVLIADDDWRLLEYLREYLVQSGYEVLIAGNGLETLEQAQTQDPDLIILDILMPHMDGLQVLAELRRYSKTPVIILSSQTSDAARIKGLNLGADDFLIKPFNIEELATRVKAVIRRSTAGEHGETNNFMRLGDITIDFNTKSVKIKNKTIPLTLIEWQLLRELAVNSGHLIQYEQLLSKIWGPEYADDVQLLRTWISRLRHKLENETQCRLIKTVRNTGYIMELTVSHAIEEGLG